MRGLSAVTVVALAFYALSGSVAGLQSSRRNKTWQGDSRTEAVSRSGDRAGKHPDAARFQNNNRRTDRSWRQPEVAGLDLQALCLKHSVLSIEDPVASKYGTMKGWMMQNEWGLELRKINATEHPTVRIGIDGFPCAKYGCCRHSMTIRIGGSDWFVVQNVINEYAMSLAALVPWSPKAILEGGGNIGVATSLFAFMYPDAKIISLEPEPENCGLLKENTKMFKNVEVVCLGLWDKEDAAVRLFQGGDGQAWAWRLEEVAPGTPGALKATSVSALLKQHSLQKFDMAKIDIEGAEFHVFKPEADTQWVNETEVMMLELHWRYGNIETLRSKFKSSGFSHYLSGEYDVFTRRRLNIVQPGRRLR